MCLKDNGVTQPRLKQLLKQRLDFILRLVSELQGTGRQFSSFAVGVSLKCAAS